MTDDPIPPASEAAEQAMRLHADLPRVMRLSRRVLVGLGVAASVAIGATLIYALQQRPPAPPANTDANLAPAHSQPDGLTSLPRDYSAVPRLGPPLPGDLGRPILSAQGAASPALAPAPVDADPRQAAQALDAARASRLFVTTAARPTTPEPAAETAAAPALASLAGLGLAPQPATPTATERQLAFLKAPADQQTTATERLAPPASPYVVQAGSVIPAALVTGLRSDLPGEITAQVTENVYDSPTGKVLLVPQGAKLIGQYDSDVGFGQQRLLLVWTRLIMPNGASIVLEREPGADAEGFSDLQDGVDYHFGDIAKAAGLATLLSVGAELATSDDNRLVQAIRDGAQDTINDAGQQIVRQQLAVKPTLTIRAGFPVRVLVTHDLVLAPYGG